MADTPLQPSIMLYNSVVPINRDVHDDLGVDVGLERYEFARGAHLIPALLDEFVIGGRSLPIVFAPGLERPSAVFLTGTATGHNAFVAADGRWLGRYVPAYLRRYPFIIGETGPDQRFLCIDEAWSGCKHDSGERLFASNAETPFLRAQLDFATEYLAAAQRTEQFIELVISSKMLKGINILFGRDGMSKQSMHGLMVIDEERISALANDEFQKLRPYLPFIYAQQHSLEALKIFDEAMARGDQ